MILHPKVVLDQIGHARRGPDGSRIAMGFGSLREQVHHGGFLLCRQLGGYSGAGLGVEGLRAPAPGDLTPMAHRSFAHSQRLRDVLLFPSCLLEFPRSMAPPLPHRRFTHWTALPLVWLLLSYHFLMFLHGGQ